MFRLGKKVFAVGGIAVVLMGTAAFSMKGHSYENRAEWVTERVATQLDLNTTQQEALSKVTTSYMEIRGTAPDFMLELSSKLKELADDKTLTSAEVGELQEQIKAEFDRRADLIVPEIVAFYNGLDETQKDQVMERFDKMSDRIEKRSERQKGKRGE